MKHIRWFLVSSIAVLMSVSAFAGTKPSETTHTKVDYLNAFTLNDYGSFEYPLNTDLTVNSLNSELNNIIDYAKKYEMDSIFFSARTTEGAYYHSEYFSGSPPMFLTSADPLQELCKKAAQNKIDVYASVNIFETTRDNPPLMGKLENQTYLSNGNPLINYQMQDNTDRVTSALAELVKNYSVKGILLTGFDALLAEGSSEELDVMQQLITEIYENLSSYDTGKTIGISLDASIITNNKVSKVMHALCEEGYIDFIVPVINTTTDDISQQAILYLWDYFSQTYDVKIYTMHLASKMFNPTTANVFFSNPHEVLYQLYLNHSVPMDGSVVSSYRDLQLNMLNISESIYHVSKETSLSGYENLIKKPKQELDLAISEERIVTTENSYYITGTSDPYSTLTVNNNPIRRKTKNGVFEIEVNLDEGTNIFTFRQNANSKTISIFRATAEVNKIKQMDRSTAYPRYNEVLLSETAPLRITAPAGAGITAMIGNTVYTLEPEVIAEKGTPVTYSAAIKIPSTALMRDLGSVVYSMNYNNLVTTSKSAGRLYSPATATPVVAEVASYFGNVYSKPYADASMEYPLKEGTRDIILSSENDFYQLQSGGYIPKEQVEIPMITQPVNAEHMNYVDNVVMSTDENMETFTLIGCEHAPSTIEFDEERKTVLIKIFNIENFPVSLSHLNSTFFKDINVTINGTTVSLEFVLPDYFKLWGTDIRFADGNMNIVFRTPPKISTSSIRPLKGVKIFLDPAYGGDSRGVASPIGEFASDEADLNLLNAYALMIKLRSLGATVIMARTEDTSYATDDRLKLAESFDPDIYINLKHTAQQTIYENPFSVYYTTGVSSELAKKVALSVGSNLKNRNTDSRYTKLRPETQITYCPSVSIDLGVITNPQEYELLTDTFEIYKTASAIAAAITETILAF